MTELTFMVLGRPQQKGSKRVVPVRGKRPDGGRSFNVIDDNRRSRPWAQTISHVALLTMADERGAERGLIRGPVGVELAFYFARPRGHYGTGRNLGKLRLGAPMEMTTTPDVDKLARCAIDALIGVVLADDKQIVELDALKRYGDPERVEIKVIELMEVDG